MKKIMGFIKLIRPINCLMMGIAVIVGAFIAAQDSSVTEPHVNKLVMAFITAFTLTGASMAINDYYDVEIDSVNEPDRPIPSGIISPMESLLLTIILTLIGLISAFFTNVPCLLAALASWAISITYSTIGKRTGLPGNLLVSACIATPFIYGSLALKGFLEINTIIFAALAFLSNAGREIAKGIADMEGDRIKGIRTLAISYGAKKAAYASAAFFIAATLLSPLPLVLKMVHVWFLPPLIAADIGFLASSRSLIKDYTRENAKKVKNTVLLWMTLGLISFISGTIG